MGMHFSNDAHGWAELLPARTPNPACQGALRCHWAVIGAGFTGLAAARRLAELHPEQVVVVLEARALAQAASGRNSGYAVACSHFPGPFDPAQAANYARVNRINAAGLALLRTQVQQQQIDCQWHEQGFYHTAAEQQSAQEADYFAEYLGKMELPHRVLEADELAAELGTGWYQRGVKIEAGALVQPAALVYGLAAGLPANVQLYENSPVLQADWKTAPLVLSTPQATVRADRVLVAANFEARQLGLIKSLILGSTLSGSFTRRLTATERAGLGSEMQWGVLSLHSGGATVRLTADGRISVRNTAEYYGGRLLSDKRLQQRRQIHRQAFENRFPALTHVPFEYHWSGVEGVSRNGTNFFQQPAAHVYLAGGYNGSGVSRGTAFGNALAEYAGGGQSQLITDCLDSAPAQWLPPRPLLDVGAWLTVRKRFRGVGRDR